MTIDVDSVLTDVDLNTWLGGQGTGATNLKPKAWPSLKPARDHALAETLRILGNAHPSIAETDIVDTSKLEHAVKLGSAARLYELAITNAADASVFYAMEKKYRTQFEDEVRRLADEINRCRLIVDPKRRSRRVVSFSRR